MEHADPYASLPAEEAERLREYTKKAIAERPKQEMKLVPLPDDVSTCNFLLCLKAIQTMFLQAGVRDYALAKIQDLVLKKLKEEAEAKAQKLPEAPKENPTEALASKHKRQD